MRNIKLWTILLVVATIFTSCKKDSEKAFSETKVTKRLVSSLVYAYGSDTTTVNFSYDANGHISEIKSMNPYIFSANLTKYTFFGDSIMKDYSDCNKKRVIEYSQLNDFCYITSSKNGTFTYNAKNQLTNLQCLLTNGQSENGSAIWQGDNLTSYSATFSDFPTGSTTLSNYSASCTLAYTTFGNKANIDIPFFFFPISFVFCAYGNPDYYGVMNNNLVQTYSYTKTDLATSDVPFQTSFNFQYQFDANGYVTSVTVTEPNLGSATITVTYVP
jgi:hypothetical protein